MSGIHLRIMRKMVGLSLLRGFVGGVAVVMENDCVNAPALRNLYTLQIG